MRFRLFPPFQTSSEFAELVSRIELPARVVSTAPVEEDAIDRPGLGCERADERAGNRPVIVAPFDAQPLQQCIYQRCVETLTPAAEQLRQLRRFAE